MGTEVGVRSEEAWSCKTVQMRRSRTVYPCEQDIDDSGGCLLETGNDFVLETQTKDTQADGKIIQH